MKIIEEFSNESENNVRRLFEETCKLDGLFEAAVIDRLQHDLLIDEE